MAAKPAQKAKCAKASSPKKFQNGHLPLAAVFVGAALERAVALDNDDTFSKGISSTREGVDEVGTSASNKVWSTRESI